MSQPKTVLRSLSELGNAPLFPVPAPEEPKEQRRQTIRVPYTEAMPYLAKLLAKHTTQAAAMAAIGYTAHTATHWADSGSVPRVALLAMKWETRDALEAFPRLDELLTPEELKWLTGALVKSERYDLAAKFSHYLAGTK